jgi:type IX secretion system PorP/SprF family membrane protein
MSIVNPAYATSNKDVINIGGIYRSQWVGAIGAPKTGSLFMHAPINENIELGFSIINDKIGDGIVNENFISGDFAYVLKLNEKTKLSFGLKAGLNFFNTNFNGLYLPDGTIVGSNSFDPSVDNINKTFLNIGAGTFLYTDNYYVGLSVPNFLKNKHLKNSNALSSIGTDELHFFLTAGYVFKLNENLKFKPAFMFKAVDSAPISTDLSLNFLIYEKLTLGISHRFEDSVSALAGFQITPKLKIGYAYDYTTSNLGDFNTGSHEIIMLFDISTLGKGYNKSPRFF